MNTVRKQLLQLLNDDAAATSFQSLNHYREWLKGEVLRPAEPPTDHPHYFFDVSEYDFVDIYRLIEVIGITCPVAQHVFKKAAVTGERGHKDLTTDWQNIADSAKRKLQMIDENTVTTSKGGLRKILNLSGECTAVGCDVGGNGSRQVIPTG